MPITYPPAPPTISGDNLTISRFLNSPTLITRRLRTIAENRFIADFLLQGRYNASGGAVLFEQNESIFPSRPAEAIEPGSRFPQVPVTSGPALLAGVKKWGLETPITDEAVKRQGIDPVNRANTKLVNGVVQQVDSVALAAIAASVTQTFAAANAWTTSAATIFRDVMRARAVILGLNQGYDPDTVVLSDTLYAYAASDATLASALRREDPNNPVYTAQLPQVAGMFWTSSPNLPAGVSAMVLDRKVLGGLADEVPLQGGSRRDEADEQVFVKAKRVTVPAVVEPNAAIKLTGV